MANKYKKSYDWVIDTDSMLFYGAMLFFCMFSAAAMQRFIFFGLDLEAKRLVASAIVGTAIAMLGTIKREAVYIKTNPETESSKT